MIEVKNTIEKISKIIENPSTEKEISYEDLVECLEALKDISEEKDVHRYEVVATGYVKELSYIHHKDKQNRLVKFLLEKMRRDSNGKAIRGRIACVMVEDRLNEKILDGDRVKIWADFSPYTTTREDGMTFHKMKLWVDRLERIEKGTSDYIPRKDLITG